MQMMRGRAIKATGAVLRLAGAAIAVMLLRLNPVMLAPREAVTAARAAQQAGEYASAADEYRRAYAMRPWDVELLAAAAEASSLAGDQAAVLDDLTELSRQRPLADQELLWQAEALAGLGRTDEALAIREGLWARGAADTAALAGLADGYLAQGDRARALAALADLAARGAASAAQLYRLGLLQALDQPDQAAGTLGQAAALDASLAPDIAEVLSALQARSTSPLELADTRLGAAYLRINEIALAEAALERAVLTNPAYATATGYLAYARALLDKPALGAAQQAEALAPQDPVVLYLAGLAWKHSGRPHEARLLFERAEALDPGNPAYAIEIAATHRAEGAYALAELWMDQAVSLAPQDARIRLLRAALYIDANYRVEEKGLPLAQALVSEQPDSAEAHALLGWAYYLTGEVGQAFTEIDAALALEPDLARALAHKGALLESQQRDAEAAAYYRRAVEVDPDGPFGVLAAEALERIGQQ